MSLVSNEQIKLAANAFDRASTACFTVGIATPLAGYLYNVAGFRGSVHIVELAIGLAGWITAAIALHLAGRRALKGLRDE
jgi:multisubunit Na+/H+ antiporter MnhG subunit